MAHQVWGCHLATSWALGGSYCKMGSWVGLLLYLGEALTVLGRGSYCKIGSREGLLL